MSELKLAKTYLVDISTSQPGFSIESQSSAKVENTIHRWFEVGERNALSELDIQLAQQTILAQQSIASSLLRKLRIIRAVEQRAVTLTKGFDLIIFSKTMPIFVFKAANRNSEPIHPCTASSAHRRGQRG